jgi:hypothetical protein
VALDCTVGCAVEAPTGSVKVSAEPGVDVAPATDEALMVTSDGGLVRAHHRAARRVDPGETWMPTAVALPPPEPAPLDGVTASAVPAAGVWVRAGRHQ